MKLTEGLYNISVYVYSNAIIRIPGSKTPKCIESVKPGFLGFFGAKEEKCFDLEIPSQDLTNAMTAGGKVEQYVSESELEKGRAEISVEALAMPKSLEELQKNYELLEEKNVYLDFK